MTGEVPLALSLACLPTEMCEATILYSELRKRRANQP